eukprot:CAMPEP_0196574594 /NCGR_PEP_ID=MMETSP1081-20130531/4286_1 /TAXON_ID=36882 /ORGANISM="Pyramimonas amylifera, Strain CCMP720" /LENGTH=279 /DNA_ID=CAMNT_0041892673 /DNA_START=349 /DNA_END=1188 /DNA_ORIENTATION=-
MITKKNGCDYAIMSDGVGIPFEVYGPEAGVPCILTPGGKGGIEVERASAQVLAQAGLRVVIHDRRNTGRADIGFGDGSQTELNLQAADTLALVRQLGMTPCVFMGCSSGARMSLLCALEDPSAVKALVLRNMTGGRLAAHVLAEEYHYQFVEACEEGGLAAVARTPHYQSLLHYNPENRERLLDSDLTAELFMRVEQMSGDQLASTGHFPVIGVSAGQLATIKCPTKIVYSFGEPDDKMHTKSVMIALAHHLQGTDEAGVCISEDWDALSESIKFVNKL